EDEGRIVDPGIELGRDRVDQRAAALLEELHRSAQLGVAAEFDAERHAAGVRPQPESAAQFLREQRERVVLAAAAQEHAAGAAITRLLALGEAETLAVEGLGPVDVVDKQ